MNFWKKGFEGYIDCLMERQSREIRILDKLYANKIILSDADKNWNEAYDIINTTIVDRIFWQMFQVL